jgi:predicted molibdopterin-dependent oxidoreductase YjgC
MPEQRITTNMMDKHIIVHIDGRAVTVSDGTSVVAALVIADSLCTRRSVSGEPRFAVCGMGLCQECRVTIDGIAHRLACQSACRDGMVIDTAAGSAK